MKAKTSKSRINSQQRYNSKFKHRVMTSGEFNAFMQDNGLSIQDMMLYLGMGRNAIVSIMEDKTKIKHPIKMACVHYHLIKSTI